MIQQPWLTDARLNPEVTDLDDLYAQVAHCQRCGLCQTATQAVPGAGHPRARVMFIGEAPGRNEDLRGVPFVGQAGKLLDKMLMMIHLDRSEVYIANVIKHRPPDNRDPLPAEIEACKPWLRWQLRFVKPQVVATLGRFSMNLFLPEVRITQAHGKVYRAGAFTVFPLYHPAAALRNGNMMASLQQDVLSLGHLLGTVEASDETSAASPHE